MAWNGSDGKRTPRVMTTRQKSTSTGRRRIPASLKGILSFLIIVVGVAACWLCLRDDGNDVARQDAAPPKNVAKPVKVTRQKATHPKVEQPTAEPVKPTSTNSPKWKTAQGLDPSLFPYKDGRKVLSTFTNNFEQIVDICIMPNGRSRKVVRNAKPPVFQHATDQLISIALSGSNDEELPPMPIGDDMEGDFFESLKTPIVIKSDDSDAIRQAKENVIEARKIIEAELRKGRSFKEILDEHLAQRKNNQEMRETAMTTVRELQAEGDPEMLNEYIEKVNGLLREKGIGEISEPSHNSKRH